MSDTRDPKTMDRRGGDALDAEAVAALDAEIRSLRDEPLAADSLMRMRAGLDARIEAASAAEVRRPPPISSRMRGRFGAGLLAAALAAAGALILLLLPALESLRSGPPQPQRVVERDAPPAPEHRTDEGGLLPAEQRVVERDALPAPEHRAGEGGLRPADQRVVERHAPPAPEHRTDEGAAPPPIGVDEVSDEALAIAFELELLSDYDVIAQLDLLELLDEAAPAMDTGRTGGEGRI